LAAISRVGTCPIIGKERAAGTAASRNRPTGSRDDRSARDQLRPRAV